MHINIKYVVHMVDLDIIVENLTLCVDLICLHIYSTSVLVDMCVREGWLFTYP